MTLGLITSGKVSLAFIGTVFRSIEGLTAVLEDAELLTATLEDAIDVTLQSLSNVTTIQTLDSVRTDQATAVKWQLVAEEVANPANRYASEIFATHNGTMALDATDVDYNEFGTVTTGSPIDGLEFSVDLTGVGVNQEMRLRVVSTDAVNVRSRRVIL